MSRSWRPSPGFWIVVVIALLLAPASRSVAGGTRMSRSWRPSPGFWIVVVVALSSWRQLHGLSQEEPA